MLHLPRGFALPLSRRVILAMVASTILGLTACSGSTSSPTPSGVSASAASSSQSSRLSDTAQIKASPSYCLQAVGVAPASLDPCCSQSGTCGSGESPIALSMASRMSSDIGYPVEWRSPPSGRCQGGIDGCFIGANIDPNQLACDGTPQSCANINCGESPYPIGAIIPGGTITEENSVWDGKGQASGGTPLGFMYRLNNGQRLFQPDYNNRTVWGANVNFGPFFGVSATQSSGLGTIVPWNGLLPPGTHLEKCETGGSYLA